MQVAIKIHVTGASSGSFTAKDTGEVVTFANVYSLTAIPFDRGHGYQGQTIKATPDVVRALKAHELPGDFEGFAESQQFGKNTVLRIESLEPVKQAGAKLTAAK
jgi:hypothetical protein